MPEQSILEQYLLRNGTSQTGRLHPALDPDYVSVDERSTQDLLAFAQAYAQELQYIGVNSGVDQAMGDWRGFFNSGPDGDALDLDEVVAFMQEPTAFSDEKQAFYGRPHFALFLSFLQLMRHAQDQLNTITRRHLDFYYQQVLNLAKQPSIPDEVHVLVDLAPNTPQYLLPSGTLLSAGTDSLGQDRVYQLDREIVASQAQVAKLSSVYVNTGVSDSIDNTDPDSPNTTNTEWLIYAAEDATAVSVTGNNDTGNNDTDANDADVTPHWKTFGQRETLVPLGSPPPPEFGWAIASPLLALSQGTRTITLVLGFEPTTSDDAPIDSASIQAALDANALRIQASTENGWVEPLAGNVQYTYHTRYTNRVSDSKYKGGTLSAIQIVVTFDETVDPITPLLTQGNQPDNPWPLLRVMVRQLWQSDPSNSALGQYTIQYLPFKGLQLAATDLSVSAHGVTPQQAQNDETALDPTKPFDPFGTQPKAGSRFYLGHSELVYKPLDRLDFHFEWMGGIEDNDLSAYYRNYPALEDASFTTKVILNDNRSETELDDNAALFVMNAAHQPMTIEVASIAAEPLPSATEQTTTLDTVLDIGGDLLDWDRYFIWELNAPDFQHTVYPAVAMKKSLELALAISDPNKSLSADVGDYQVNPPYTPQLKTLSLAYDSSIEVIISDYIAASSPNSSLAQLYQVETFGYREIAPPSNRGQDAVAWLPQYDFAGELYIGIQDASPPQNLSLLFQVAEGSADPDLTPVPVQWSYLTHNRWVSLDDGHILSDTTRGLINSGVIVFSLPPASPNTLLDPDLYWLRVAIPSSPNSVCDTVALHTQAVRATFVDQNNAADHFLQPLPADSITDLTTPVPQVTGIRQPYTSFGGKPTEGDGLFYTRISERLRHKQRALTAWDYENMILGSFPDIYRAKCLPASREQLGMVTTVVIPDIRNQHPFNPFAPKAPANLIADIETHLAHYVPAFATVQVTNATYIAVKVDCVVTFLPEVNAPYFTQVLNDEITRLLSPWAYEDGADVVVNGRLYANVLIDFIEDRPYVESVAHFTFYRSNDGHRFHKVPHIASDSYWVETKNPDEVLASARTHTIRLIADIGDPVIEPPGPRHFGINYMAVEVDFIVGPVDFGDGNPIINPPVIDRPVIDPPIIDPPIIEPPPVIDDTGINYMAVEVDFVVGSVEPNGRSQKIVPSPVEPPKTDPTVDKPERDKPERDKPKRDKPERDKPERDKPERDKPERDKPKRDKPERDRPKHDRPKRDKPERDKRTGKQ